MALHAYSVTDGSTTFSLTSGSTCITRGYTPVAPDTDGQERTLATDGAEFDIPRYKNVTETIELLILGGGSDSTLKSNVHTLEQLLSSAKLRQAKKIAPRVYLQVQIDTDSSAWRSEIMSAKLELDKDALAVYGNYQIPYLLHITRRFFFEGARSELSISANGQSAATGGRTVTNNANNWIQIANSQVGGSLPTPIELQLTNSTGGSVGYRHYFLATNAFSSPASFTQELGSGSVTLSGSGSNYSGEISYSLSSTQMGYTQGRPFKLLARFTSQGGGTLYCKPIVRDTNNLLTLCEGDEVYMPAAAAGTQFIDLGSLPLPPGGYNTAWGGISLTLLIRGAGSYAVVLASIKLMSLDSYQYIVQRGFSITSSGTATFDNIEQVYHAGGQSIFSIRNGRLMVWPGVTQRINILQDEGTSSDTAKTFSVRAYVRERRLTI